LHELGYENRIISKPEEVLTSDRLILPGVGAFPACMVSLRESNLLEALHERVLRGGVPFLGICLGMQVMASTGEEMGTTPGLGWIPGTVKRFEIDPSLSVPHIGWNEIDSRSTAPWSALSDRHMYFVHSYHVVCDSEENVVATADYGGKFTAAILRDNMLGVQFHPEKSGKSGQSLLLGFLDWNP
jgi:glutamine amidotransferase